MLQFTSGTTAVPRAVPVRHGQVASNLATVIDSVRVRAGETIVSWLPLYHDMGILSIAGGILCGQNMVIMSPDTFVSRPASWLEALATYRAVATAAPNFAYALIARHLTLTGERYDLSTLRCALNGAEAVTPDSLHRFMTAAGRHGMDPTAPCPVYGLAEATLAVTVTHPGEMPRTLTVAREELETGNAVPVTDGSAGRTLVSCGRALAGTDVTIIDPSGASQPDGRVGEIRVEGPGVIPAYWPDGSATVDSVGRLMTGDLGFRYDGELYICGRDKDLIIVGGRNLYPEDYELVAEAVPGVRAGRCQAA